VEVRTWQRAFLGAVLVGAVAVAGIALNFTLLRLTQDAHDPVGRLSPRAVFSGSRTTTLPATADDAGTSTAATTTPAAPGDDRDRDHDRDD
jgi:hypothetical protein